MSRRKQYLNFVSLSSYSGKIYLLEKTNLEYLKKNNKKVRKIEKKKKLSKRMFIKRQ